MRLKPLSDSLMEEFPLRIERTPGTVVSIIRLLNHNDHDYANIRNERVPTSPGQHDDAAECTSPVQDTLSQTEETAVRACLGCLATEPKLYDIYENNLYEVFGEVVGNPIFESDDRPQHICATCYAHLSKYVAFRTRCRSVQDLLEDLTIQGLKITAHLIQEIDRNKYNLLPNLKSVTLSTSDLVIEEEFPDEPPLSQDDEGMDHEPAEHLSPSALDENPPFKSTPADMNQQTKTRKPHNTMCSFILNDPQKAEEFSNKYNMDIVFLTEEERIEDMKRRIDESTKVTDRPYCPKCGRIFRSDAGLQNHTKNYHDEWVGPVQCDICKYRFTSEGLLNHVCNKIKFTCKKCGLSLKRPPGAISHARKHGIVRSKEYKCKYCDSLFVNSDTLKSHIHIEHPDVLAWCTCCGESFLNKRGLARHLFKIHNEFLTHHCQECNVKFATSEALERHSSLTCEGYNCVMCGEHFDVNSVFKDHVIKEHTRCKYIKLAHCDGCGVKFFGKDPLVKHLELRCCGSGHPCALCGVNFPTTEDMEHHNFESHPKLYRICESCDKAFDADNYRRHIFRAHNTKPPQHRYYGLRTRTATKHWSVRGGVIAGAEAPRASQERPQQHLMCHYCGKTFTKQLSMRLHTLVHTGERPHVCGTCGQGFIRKQSLKAHEHLHTGERPYACHVCPAAFRRRAALARHLLWHSEIRRHVCQVCGKSFRTSSCVKIHIRGVHLNIPNKKSEKRKFHARNSLNGFSTENNTRTQDFMDGDTDKNVPVEKIRRLNKRVVEQTDRHLQGLMESDVTQSGMVYDTDSVNTGVPRVIKIVNLKRKPKPKNSLPTSDSKDNNTLEDYMNSEAYGKDIASTSDKIRTKSIKKTEIARKLKHVDDKDYKYVHTQDFIDENIEQGIDKTINQDFKNSNVTRANVYGTLSKTVPVTVITKQISGNQRKKLPERSMPTLFSDNETT